MTATAPTPRLTEVDADGAFCVYSVGPQFLDDVVEHVSRNVTRRLQRAPAFAGVPFATFIYFRRIVSETFEAVAGELLTGRADVLHPKHERRIRNTVAANVLDKWTARLPFRGRLLKLLIRIAVAIALGYLRTQFPIIAAAQAANVAYVLQSVVDRKPVQ